MAASTIRVVAHLRAREGLDKAVKAALSALVEATRGAAGCLRYELLEGAQDPTDFVALEEWTSTEALDAHMRTAHVQAALAKCGPLLGGAPEIRLYRAV